MSEQQLKVFLEKVQSDTSLQEKFKAAKSPEDVVGTVREYGREFNSDHLNELSEDELVGVAGDHRFLNGHWGPPEDGTQTTWLDRERGRKT